MTPRRKTFMSDFRTFFFRGLGILLPSVVTLALLWWAYGFVKVRIAEPINWAVRQGVVVAMPHVVPEGAHPGWYRVSDEDIAAAQAKRRAESRPALSDDELRKRVRAQNLQEVWRGRWYLQAIGFVVAIILVYLAGVLVGNYLGRRIYLKVESWLVRLPGVKQVYPHVKQVVDFVFGEKQGAQALKVGRVVVVEYPRKGIWSVGLMTGESLSVIEEAAGSSCVTVFIPSSPTPFTGYTITVLASEVMFVDLSLDEALRFVVSGGVLVPEKVKGSTASILREDAGADLAGGGGAAKIGGATLPPTDGGDGTV
ncbi:MAG: DUF502 domain-containing protein [Phycisphaerales bacterium]|nr:DUF502 domain-containing protein [Phycisphaerales bacterium]